MTDKTLKIEGRQQALKSDWSNNINELESSIDQCVNEQMANITSMHQEQLDQVRRLVAKKVDIESRIAATTAELQESYVRTKKILEIILAGRLEDCQEGLKLLDGVHDNQDDGQT